MGLYTWCVPENLVRQLRDVGSHRGRSSAPAAPTSQCQGNGLEKGRIATALIRRRQGNGLQRERTAGAPVNEQQRVPGIGLRERSSASATITGGRDTGAGAREKGAAALLTAVTALTSIITLTHASDAAPKVINAVPHVPVVAAGLVTGSLIALVNIALCRGSSSGCGSAMMGVVRPPVVALLPAFRA